MGGGGLRKNVIMFSGHSGGEGVFSFFKILWLYFVLVVVVVCCYYLFTNMSLC
jgi:hypothetical protein